MNNSSRFFANRECEYYPCHDMGGDLNCLFCYCPLYNTKCPGNFTVKEKDGRKIKSCIDCTFPHEAGNYDKIMEILKGGKINES